MYTYGCKARHAERQRGLMKLKLQPAVELALARADRLMRRSLRYGALPIYLLPRKAPVLLPTTHYWYIL